MESLVSSAPGPTSWASANSIRHKQMLDDLSIYSGDAKALLGHSAANDARPLLVHLEVLPLCRLTTVPDSASSSLVPVCFIVASAFSSVFHRAKPPYSLPACYSGS